MGGAVVAARLGVGAVTSEGEKSTKQGDTGIWTVAWVPRCYGPPDAAGIHLMGVCRAACSGARLMGIFALSKSFIFSRSFSSYFLFDGALQKGRCVLCPRRLRLC